MDVLGDFWFYPLALIGVTLTGISKSGFAGGAGVVAIPLLVFVMPLSEALALMLPLLLIMDVRTIQYYKAHLHTQTLKQIIPAAILGITAGGLLLGYLSEALLNLILASCCITFACWQSLAPKLAKHRGSGLLWGSISGLSSTLIHSGGPPINIYLLGKQLDKLTWLATSAYFFGAMNLIKIIPYSLNDQWNQSHLLISIFLIPFCLLGVWLGKEIQHKVSETLFVKLCRALLLISGLMLLLKQIY